MKCEKYKEDLISLVYGEIDAEAKKRIEAHLARCGQCRQELKELQDTCKTLETWEDEHPEIQYVFVKTEPFIKKVWNAFSDLAWPKKAALSVCTALLAVFFIMSAAHTTITGGNGAFRIALGVQNPAPGAPVQTAALPQLSQEEIIALVSRMIEESEKQQQDITDYKLVQMADHFNKARQTDLVTLGEEMQGIHRSAQGQFNKTYKVLNGLIQLASNRYNN